MRLKLKNFLSSNSLNDDRKRQFIIIVRLIKKRKREGSIKSNIYGILNVIFFDLKRLENNNLII